MHTDRILSVALDFGEEETKKRPFRISFCLVYGNVGAELECTNEVGRLALFEADDAIFEGKEGVVGSHANVLSRVDFGATLTNDDLTGGDGLTISTLHAETLGLRIATISCRSLG
jgi:hypothetical protein